MSANIYDFNRHPNFEQKNDINKVTMMRPNMLGSPQVIQSFSSPSNQSQLQKLQTLTTQLLIGNEEFKTKPEFEDEDMPDFNISDHRPVKKATPQKILKK